MKKVLAFSGSLSSDSINQKLVSLTTNGLINVSFELIQLADYEAPLYAKQREVDNGIPEEIIALRKLFDECDGFIISTPEYNSSIPAGLKNTFDWISRMDGKTFQDKPVLLMSATPGGRGGKSVLDHLSAIIPFWGASEVIRFSLPTFYENFLGNTLAEPFNSELNITIQQFEKVILADSNS